MTKRTPRILHCVSHLALGGAERVATTLVHALRDEFEFGIYAVRGLGDGETGAALERELRDNRVPVFHGPRVPMRFGGMLTGAWGMLRAIRAFAPDLIHLHTEIPESSYAVMVTARPGLRRIPLLRTIHNTVFWEFAPALGHWCDRRMVAGHCVGVSQGAADAVTQLRRASGATAMPSAPIVIHNGVTPAPRVRDRTPGADAPIELVFGGRFEGQKGVDLLPVILRRTPLPPGRSVRLSLFGDGDFRPLLRQLAQTPPPGWTVRLFPPAPDFRHRLADYDLLLLPSRFEGLPLIALEAALAELPMVATDDPGIREVIGPDNPWVARAGDADSFASALGAALAEPDRWPAIAAHTRMRVEQQFSLEAMAGSYRSVYQRLVGTGPDTSAPAP